MTDPCQSLEVPKGWRREGWSKRQGRERRRWANRNGKVGEQIWVNTEIDTVAWWWPLSFFEKKRESESTPRSGGFSAGGKGLKTYSEKNIFEARVAQKKLSQKGGLVCKKSINLLQEMETVCTSAYTRTHNSPLFLPFPAPLPKRMRMWKLWT